MSIHSHKSSPPAPRAVQPPQRSNGKLRVAAILEAAAAVMAERGYEGATMAEIAARSGTKIGSLYRFFPNKESLADTIVVSAREHLDAAFDRFDAGVATLPAPAVADALMDAISEHFKQPALLKLLEAGREWSIKREEFRDALVRRVAGSLKIHTPGLSKKSAANIAYVVVLNVKTVATHKEFFRLESGVADEFRAMTRLYVQDKLANHSATTTKRSRRASQSATKP